jgi:hypothetical protein
MVDTVEDVVEQPYENPKTKQFLERWDRSLSDEKRCYGIKFLFAGCESPSIRDGLYRIGAQRILVSYYYLRKQLRKRSVQDIAEDFGRFEFVFLDSGGFTFRVMQDKGEGLDMSVRDYADEFYTEIQRLKGIFAGVAEVDVDELGTEYMEQKKDEAWAAGVPIVPVVQPPRLEPYLELGWFEKYPYIAVGSAALGNKHIGFLNQVYREAKASNVLIHGLGATKAEILARSQFYSVDSTTWLNGSKYGSTQLFVAGRLRHYDFSQKDVRKKYRKRYEEHGLVWEDIEAEKCEEVDLSNALAWKQYADYLRYTAARCYWLTPEEKDHSLTLRSKAFNADGIIDRGTSLARAQHRRITKIDDADYDDRAHELLHCDTCHLTGKCPRYKRNEACGYDINIRLKTAADFQKAVQTILEVEFGRVMAGVLFEKIDGGQIDRNVSAEMQKFLAMCKDARDIFSPRTEESVTITAKSKNAGGGGGVAAMLAGVLSPTGSGTSGSGNSAVQRAAGKVIDVDAQGE